MKKILFGLALSFFLLTSANASEFNSNLRFGSKGTEVKKLQEFLVEQNLYSGPITGNFFSLTLKALKNFQSANNILPASGYFGPLTRAKVNEVLDSQLADLNAEADEPVVEPKTTDDVVSKLNEQLALQKTQNDLLQQQIRNQQGALDQIVMNTTPPPAPVSPPAPVLNPDFIAKRTRGGSGQDSVEFKAIDDDFKINAMVVTAPTYVDRTDYIPPGVEPIMANHWGWRTGNQQGLNFIVCPTIVKLFTERSLSFPYLCPGQNIALNSWDAEPDKELGYIMMDSDWQSRARDTMVINQREFREGPRTMYIPPNTRVDYIKATGINTGKVIELYNL